MGRRGVTRRLVEDPDQDVIIPLSGTCACGRCCAEIGAEVLLPERRQVVEVAIQRAVTEYRIVGGTCTCGRVQRSAFPEGVTATAQYGPGVSALAVYLTQSQLLSYQGTAELFQELAGIALSPGTTDLHVPFDNNQAERDLRMLKLIVSTPRPGSTPSP